MLTQVAFQPSAVTSADGWVQVVGGTQPPNRALPAPIFDNGTNYRPNNGNTGTWFIEKTLFTTDAAGPGFLTVPPGVFPTGGGLYADDQVSVFLNGVLVPFTGTGTGVIPAQSVPVQWLNGANVLRIVVNNTVAGGTSVAGRLIAAGPGMPCDCCPCGDPRCGLVETVFDGDKALIFQGGPGITGSNTPEALAIWSNWDVAGFNFNGFNSPPVQLDAVTSPIVDLSFGTPQNRVRGLREWNQGGSDLNDLDGFASWDFEFFAGAVSLATGNMLMFNGSTPWTFLLPGGQELNGVTRVRLSNMRKLNPGATVAPLVREVRALMVEPVFPCRRGTVITWFTAEGILVPNADVIDCP